MIKTIGHKRINKNIGGGGGPGRRLISDCNNNKQQQGFDLLLTRLKMQQNNAKFGS